MMKPYIIGITGGSGSGKTTFLRQLTETFSKDEVCIISQDEYYLPRQQQLTDEKGIKNFDLPTSIDRVSFCKDITRLMNGELVSKQEYTFNNELATPKMITYQPAPIIVVEGIFIFHYKEIAELLDLKVFIHAKEELKVIRRIKRDRVERNYPLEDVLYRYEHHVSPAYEFYIKPYKEDADIIVNNNSTFSESLKVLIGFMKQKLLG